MNLHESLSIPPYRAPLLARQDTPAALVLGERFEAARPVSRRQPGEAARRILETTWQSWREPVPAGRGLTIVAGGRA